VYYHGEALHKSCMNIMSPQLSTPTSFEQLLIHRDVLIYSSVYYASVCTCASMCMNVCVQVCIYWENSVLHRSMIQLQNIEYHTTRMI
jgi:hypothetical protein